MGQNISHKMSLFELKCQMISILYTQEIFMKTKELSKEVWHKDLGKYQSCFGHLKKKYRGL